MEELKFRAWDKKRNEMITDAIEYESRLLGLPSPENEPINSSIGFFKDTDGRLFDVMQYIGKKDKNGIEIYEGDNVKLPIWCSRDDPAYGAYFYEGTIKFKDAKFYVESDDNGFYDSLGESKFLWNELEIIGNKYEKPEQKY